MIGAQVLLRTLLASGVDTCFMNPGTSEMHFVAALDDVPEMRSVLALFEGVAAGAADGYGRMSGRPAATLFHLGPGFGNAVANLHNARRARTPLVAVVGDHATYHQRYDAPLQSDIETLARNVSTSVIRPEGTSTLGSDAARAVAAARQPLGGVSTLILPADISWTDDPDATPASPAAPSVEISPDPGEVSRVAGALRSGAPAAFLIGGAAATGDGLLVTAALAERHGARVWCETFPARLARGAGRPDVPRLAYLAEMASAQLDGLAHLVLVGAPPPVSFFAYPGRPSDLVPDGCEVHTLVPPGQPAVPALEALADELGVAGISWRGPDAPRTPLPTGALTAQAVNQAIGALLPEGAIVSDEAATSGFNAPGASVGAPPHDWLTLTGGAIGQGLPAAAGAALACPDRRVVALQADGSALYTLQALWTMAREQLDVVTVIFNNRSYAILNMELERVGAGQTGPRAKAMLDLSHPDIDFVALATGLGVPAGRATTADDFVRRFQEALATPGPSLIEAVVPPIA